MKTVILLAVMLAMSGPARAVVGDLNRDGVVDLKDFFIFAYFGLKLPLNSEQSYHLFRFESYHL